MPTKKPIHHHLDKRLLYRLIMYAIISVVMIGIVGYDISILHVSLMLAIGGILIGVGIGFFSSRSSKLMYDKELKKVISRMDLFGGVILGLYIAFSLYRKNLIGYFVHGPSVAAVSFALVAGVMMGRIIGLRRRIKQVLTEEKIPH